MERLTRFGKLSTYCAVWVPNELLDKTGSPTEQIKEALMYARDNNPQLRLLHILHLVSEQITTLEVLEKNNELKQIEVELLEQYRFIYATLINSRVLRGLKTRYRYKL